jgi:hypothetical protein
VIQPKKAAFAALAMLIGFTLGIYLTEVVLRQALLVPFIPESDSDFREIVSKNWPQAASTAKRSGSYRILGLADSFGVSGGASNYHRRLEAILRARGYDVEVISLSVPAYSLEHELALLQRFGARYHPDLVLHAFFVGNDFGLGEPATHRYRGVRVTKLSGWSSWLPQNLNVVRWVPQWWAVRTERRRHASDQASGGQGNLSPAAFLAVERVRLGSCRRPEIDGPAWLGTTAVLDDVQRTIRGMDAGHLLVAHPDQFQIEHALSNEIIEAYGLDRALYDLDQPQRFLQAYATSRGIELVDLAPRFRAQGAGGGLYLLRDTHYNPIGNDLAAEILADAIEPRVVAFAAAAL